MYSRDEIKALSDKVLNMAKADAVEVDFTGGERSGTRWANSNITVNLVQLDQQLSVTVRLGQKTGSASTREFDDDSLKGMVDEATEAAKAARDNPNLQPITKGPQEYMPVDAALPPMVNFGPGERAEMVRYTVILESRPAARFLSLMTGIFNARQVETGPRSYLTGTEKGTSKIGQKVFSDLVTIKSDIGNPILRQTPILPDGTPAKPVTWV